MDIINLVKQIPDKNLRKAVLETYFGIIPANGKTYSIKAISANQDYYRKLAKEVDNKNSKKRGFLTLEWPRFIDN